MAVNIKTVFCMECCKVDSGCLCFRSNCSLHFQCSTQCHNSGNCSLHFNLVKPQNLYNPAVL